MNVVASLAPGPGPEMDSLSTSGGPDCGDVTPRMTRRMSRLTDRINDTEYSSMEDISQLSEADIKIRRKLRFFTMNPYEKWRVRRQIPWKLGIQIMKLFLVTLQIYLYGSLRQSHIQYLQETRTAFRHILLDKWEATRDLDVYPLLLFESGLKVDSNLSPIKAGDYSVYTSQQFYHQIAYAINQYYHINDTMFTPIDYDYDGVNHEFPPVNLCFLTYTVAQVFPFNNTYTYDTETSTDCFNISLNKEERKELENRSTVAAIANYSDARFIRNVMEKVGFRLHSVATISATVTFNLRTIHLSRSEPNDKPECFIQEVNIKFDNSAHSGKVIVSLDVNVRLADTCNGKILYHQAGVFIKFGLLVLDAAVIVLCVLSAILCTRALIRGHRLKKELEDYLQNRGESSLDWDERSEFINFWFILICVNDVLIVIGTIFKICVEIQSYESNLFTATGILLGVGNLIIWVGILRYVGFFSHYNVMILTIKKSMPNVMRFMLCAGLLYFGFMFCGWLVFAPYSLKFQDIGHTSSCLFSLINGDDMFATFYTTAKDNSAVHWFARVYLYTFVCVFTYIVLSLFIAIIMDAYEIIKSQYTREDRRNRIEKMAMECADTPRPDNFPRSPAVTPAISNILQRLVRIGRVPDYGSMVNEQPDSENDNTLQLTRN